MPIRGMPRSVSRTPTGVRLRPVAVLWLMLPFVTLALVNLLVLLSGVRSGQVSGVQDLLDFSFGFMFAVVGTLIVLPPAVRGLKGRLTAVDSRTARLRSRRLAIYTFLATPLYVLVLILGSSYGGQGSTHLGPGAVVLWAPALAALAGSFSSVYFQEIHDALVANGVHL